MTRNPLIPAEPRPWSTAFQAGTLFENTDGHVVKQFYLYAGVEDNDNFTGEPHPVRMYRFLAWQGDIFYRTRLTEAEIERKKLKETRRGLSPVQLNHVAVSLFRHWESDEYRSIELHKLKRAAK